MQLGDEYFFHQVWYWQDVLRNMKAKHLCWLLYKKMKTDLVEIMQEERNHFILQRESNSDSLKNFPGEWQCPWYQKIFILSHLVSCCLFFHCRFPKKSAASITTWLTVLLSSCSQELNVSIHRLFSSAFTLQACAVSYGMMWKETVLPGDLFITAVFTS